MILSAGYNYSAPYWMGEFGCGGDSEKWQHILTFLQVKSIIGMDRISGLFISGIRLSVTNDIMGIWLYIYVQMTGIRLDIEFSIDLMDIRPCTKVGYPTI